jgi:putative ABC transport system permease protein
MMRTLWSRMRALFLRRQLDERLDEEVQAHLDQLAADYVRRGAPPEQARLAARRAFGGVEQMKETQRDRRTFGIVTDTLRDVRFGLRLLVKEPWFTAAAVLVLSLGIAANNTVFVLLNGIMLRDMPFADPDRIVSVLSSVGGRTRPNAGMSYLDLQDLSAMQRTFDGFGGVAETTMNVADEGRVPERAVGAYVSANAFDLIGHAPILGRGFDARDDRPDAAAVVILGDALWRSRYGSDPQVIGRTIRVNGVPSTVIGIMDGGFAFPARSRLWQPLSQLSAETRERRDVRPIEGVGRLAASATPEQAADDLSRGAATLAAAYPVTNRGVEPRVVRFGERVIGGRLRTAFPILVTLVGFVLVIACANVANLLLARAAYRTREIAVRLSVGASRPHIVRQLLVESVLLASVAGIVALGLSVLVVNVFSDFMGQLEDGRGQGLPYWIRFELDWRIFTFLTAVCLGTGILFGLVPALQASRTGITRQLVQAGTGHTGSIRQRRWTTGLVVTQLALAPVLLVGAVLMVRSIIAQQDMDAGVPTHGLVRMRLSLSGPQYDSAEERARFYQQLEDRLADAPGLRATLSSQAPFERATVRRLSIDGRAIPDDRGPGFVYQMTVGRSYFAVIGSRTVRGATFAPADEGRSVVPAIVNEKFAAVHFANQDPIGHRLGLTGRDGRTLDVDVVGVAPNIRQSSTESQDGFEPIVYVTFAADPIPEASVLVQSGSLGAAAAAVGGHLRALDPDLPMYTVMRLDDSLAMSDERSGLRAFGTMIAAVGGIALVLATLGLYAVTAYATAQRAREIGIRVALGSSPSQIGWLVAERAARQLTIGLLIGTVGALAVSQLLRGLLVGVSPWDPTTLLGVLAVLVTVTTGASYIPARRAMRVNPAMVLRND